MRPNHWSVLMILLAAGTASAQTTPADTAPKAPGPLLLPPPPTTVPQPAPLPSVTIPLPPSLQATRPEPAVPSLPAPENLLTFDTQRVEVTHDLNTGWHLVVDGTVLKDFGSREGDARAALKLVRDLGLNQRGTIGSPMPVMEYWLHDGKAPHGATAGLQVYSLEPAALRVEQVQDHWCLRDAQRMLFDFGLSSADAQQALGVIRKYGFVQIATLGEPGPVLLLFLPDVKAHSSAPWPNHDWAARSSILDRRVPSPVGQPIPTVVPATPVVVIGAIEKPIGDRTPFDWRLVDVQNDGKVWKVVAGKVEIGKFLNEREAHLALSAVVNYHFTEREQVGHFSYFLTDGQLPHGAMIGTPSEVFQPERLRVVQVANRWTISTGERVLLTFDDKADEARHVLDVIQHNKCDRLCRIGVDEYGMTFLARSH